jgi:hypothetical protein
MVHFLFLLDLPVMMAGYGRRFGFPVPALAAAFLVFAAPVVGLDGTTAYVDVAAAAILFALYYLLAIWDAERSPALLIPAGILAGFAYAAKYTAGAAAVFYALGFVAWRLWRARASCLRPVLAVSAVAAFFILPWMIRNALFAGNPLAPFANSLFPNPGVHVSFEQEYCQRLRSYLLASRLQAPWELAVKGERLQGFVGPVFLLMPLAVLSLGHRHGRRLLLAGAVFAVPWFWNIGTRFLIPALPPLTLALAIALSRPAALLPVIALLHAVLCWYAAPMRYFDGYAPRISGVPWRAALRLEPEEGYLARGNPGYLVDRMIERLVPSGETVLSLEQVAESWTTRRILAGYSAALNETLVDTLRSAVIPVFRPDRALDFRFAERLLRRIRAVQTGPADGRMWSVSEFQVLRGGRPLPQDANWRITASPNPWDAGLAFDNQPVTRWRSWQDAAPGMFLQVDFGAPRRIDQIRLLTTPDTLKSRVALEVQQEGGAWRALPAEAALAEIPAGGDLRAAATRALLRRGVRYLLVSPTSFAANDFAEEPSAWGVRLAGESGGLRLYLLDAGIPDIQAPAPPADAVSAGTYDDADPHLHFRSAWTRDTQFPEPWQHSVTYSNIPGASASLAFTGSAITYLYTRAKNRGVAEIWIDGRLRDSLDLYSASTAWRSRTRYDQLGPGPHLIQIRVSGRRNALADDDFVDVDALIVE